jgi:hypothetical protein
LKCYNYSDITDAYRTRETSDAAQTFSLWQSDPLFLRPKPLSTLFYTFPHLPPLLAPFVRREGQEIPPLFSFLVVFFFFFFF